MNHEQRATVQNSAVAPMYDPDISMQVDVRPARQAKLSPLPSAREIDAAIDRKYGAPPYREMAITSA